VEKKQVEERSKLSSWGNASHVGDQPQIERARSPLVSTSVAPAHRCGSPDSSYRCRCAPLPHALSRASLVPAMGRMGFPAPNPSKIPGPRPGHTAKTTESPRSSPIPRQCGVALHQPGLQFPRFRSDRFQSRSGTSLAPRRLSQALVECPEVGIPGMVRRSKSRVRGRDAKTGCCPATRNAASSP
jgi:hypothetical protein